MKLPISAISLSLLFSFFTSVAQGSRHSTVVFTDFAYIANTSTNTVSWILSCNVQNVGNLSQAITVSGFRLNANADNTVNTNHVAIAPVQYVLAPGDNYELVYRGLSALSSAQMQNLFPKSLTFTVEAVPNGDRGAVAGNCGFTYNVGAFNFAIVYPINGGRAF
jgi:hypothetical protein